MFYLFFLFHNYQNIVTSEHSCDKSWKQGNTNVMPNLARRSPTGTTLSILDVTEIARGGSEAMVGSENILYIMVL